MTSTRHIYDLFTTCSFSSSSNPPSHGTATWAQKPPRCSKELCTNQIRLLPLGLPAFGGDVKKGSGERGGARARDPRSNFEGQAETRTISKGIGKMAAKLPTIFSSLPRHPPSTKKHKEPIRPKILSTRPCTKTDTQKTLGQNRAAKKRTQEILKRFGLVPVNISEFLAFSYFYSFLCC